MNVATIELNSSLDDDLHETPDEILIRMLQHRAKITEEELSALKKESRVTDDTVAVGKLLLAAVTDAGGKVDRGLASSGVYTVNFYSEYLEGEMSFELNGWRWALTLWPVHPMPSGDVS
jgi:hypothetical protein